MRLIGYCLAFSFWAGAAQATITGGGIVQQDADGEFVKLDTATPFTVGEDNFNTDNLYGFDENQNIVLEAPLRVDIGDPDGILPAGTEVASHYVFFDSYDSEHIGFVDFDAPILGIAASEQTMAASDFLANTSVTYVSKRLRGLERGDLVWIDKDDPARLWVFWAGWSPGDYIRVFTERSVTALMM
ncbi:hypothetical protein AN191_10415 [Loktanella sp. 5RATIMAR09]|uniref:hypothetical protein n=1 Tax=Loktanella sp. 5RATIMAR09 TaxID=1225655 RepID=UPI0006EB3762|nr:hypothetical protein [Loktanella sp. 5RATIMAR09]KQI71858.1 hypothetical protein AN191_10415 [Loktanella sp. 5RATIMAR09]